MELSVKRGLNREQLKLIAVIAMTVDHLAWVIWPGYPKAGHVIMLHCIGRITAPIMWFFIAEGYFHTRSVKRYALRLLAFALISHFAYTFAFGIPLVPFKTSVFNQTGIMWSLFWGLVGLHISNANTLKDWQKVCIILVICAVSFCADWSCIATMAVIYIGAYRGSFKKQMISMMTFVCIYAAVYALCIDRVYGIIQLFAAAAIPLLGKYNGQRGESAGKWGFYLYYPLHLALCGILRLLLHGNISAMIGG